MKTALTYLNHYIEIELPDPNEDNTIYVSIYKAKGTYDAELYNAYLTEFQFSAENPDPNRWLLEALESAIAALAGRGIYYHLEVTTLAASTDDCCLDDIPF